MARHHLVRRLWVCIPLTVIIVTLSMVPAFQFMRWEWVAAGLTLPVVTWGAWPFHSSAWKAGRHGSTTMDTLVAIGVTATTLWSLWVLLSMTFSPHHSASTASHAEMPHIYFEGAATIITFLLLGRLLEHRAKHSAGDALRSLLDMGAQQARRINPDTGLEEVIAADQLRVGDTFRTRPGEKIATDGVVIEGASALDASLLTGESLPVDVAVGDSVIGACINTWGTLTIRATRTGDDTVLTQMGRTLADAQSGKAPIQRLADRISAIFVPTVLIIALSALIGWLVFGGSVEQAVTAAVSVLVVACPCALGLATPTALLVGSGRAAQLGILIHHPHVLENSRDLKAIVLDKTGTLTTGHMTYESMVTVPHPSDGSVVSAARDPLQVAAELEGRSEHPVARAIVRAFDEAAATTSSVSPLTIQGFRSFPGLGVAATLPLGIDSRPELILIGRKSWLDSLGVNVPGSLETAAAAAESSGATAVFMARATHWEEPGNTLKVQTPAVDAQTSPINAESLTEPHPTAIVHMDIEGMTCASCVGRVERKIRKGASAQALVNLATNSAQIQVFDDTTDEELERIVDKAGYTGRVTRRENFLTPPGTAVHDTSHLQEAERSANETQPRSLPQHIPHAQAVAVFIVRDKMKSEAPQAIDALSTMGITPWIVTGDNDGAARHVASQLGITHLRSHALPHDKQRIITELQDHGQHVAMVGDGVNDAAALMQAQHQGLAIAMGNGTDVAKGSADITIMNSSLMSIPTAIDLSRSTLRVIRQNLFWAFAYNIAMIPLAVAGMLNPMIASAAMAASSVCVVLNSLRLKGYGRRGLK